MKAFLELLEQKYGGVGEYVMDYCGLSVDDVSRIQANLVASAKSRM